MSLNWYQIYFAIPISLCVQLCFVIHQMALGIDNQTVKTQRGSNICQTEAGQGLSHSLLFYFYSEVEHLGCTFRCNTIVIMRSGTHNETSIQYNVQHEGQQTAPAADAHHCHWWTNERDPRHWDLIGCDKQPGSE